MDVLSSLAAKLVDGFVVAGVVWPYIPQAKAMLASKDASGFSTKVPLVIVVSAVLRVFFWLGKPFDVALLIQAIASIITQLGMMGVVTHIGQAKAGLGSPSGAAGASQRGRSRRRFGDFDFSHFWAWDDWTSYLQFTLTLVVFLALLSGSFLRYSWFVQLLGTLALGLEAMLPVPQALRNYHEKSTAGVSSVMIISWVAGDAFKTVYAIAKEQPGQFIACGAFQLAIDVVCIYQMYVLYRGNGSTTAGKR